MVWDHNNTLMIKVIAAETAADAVKNAKKLYPKVSSLGVKPA